MYKRLKSLSFIDKYEILSKYQYGFTREKCFTQHDLIDIVIRNYTHKEYL